MSEPVEKKGLLTVSSSPHVRGPQTTQGIMRDVLIALLPASVFAIYAFGANAAVLIVTGILAAVFFEWLIEKLLNRAVTITDLSAAVTGLLIALNMPVKASWWQVAIGCAFATIVVKQTFGGLGCNFVNPALAARLLLVASWPADMTGSAYALPNAVTTATPLAEGVADGSVSIMNLFLGTGIGGSIGEVSALLLILGGIYLIVRNVISWRIPVIYIATVAVFALITGHNVPYQVLAGGLMLGAFFMATDYVTSPNTPKGEIIYAVGLGLLTCIIRYYGGYPEGVSYSIVIFNIITPLIDKLVRAKKFGEVKA